MGWTVWGSNPGGGKISAPVQTGPEAHPASCTMGTEPFPGVKSSRGMTLTPHPLLVPWTWKGRAIPLLLLRAIQPVQSLSACIRVHFTLPQCLYKGALYLFFTTWPLKTGPTDCPRTSVMNYHYLPCKSPEQHSSHISDVTNRQKYMSLITRSEFLQWCW